jgi:hypothetical protein
MSGGNLHVRFDERGEETERCRMAEATAPLSDSTVKGAFVEPITDRQMRAARRLAHVRSVSVV